MKIEQDKNSRFRIIFAYLVYCTHINIYFRLLLYVQYRFLSLFCCAAEIIKIIRRENLILRLCIVSWERRYWLLVRKSLIKMEKFWLRKERLWKIVVTIYFCSIVRADNLISRHQPPTPSNQISMAIIQKEWGQFAMCVPWSYLDLSVS
jgi:hypothetical protein